MGIIMKIKNSLFVLLFCAIAVFAEESVLFKLLKCPDFKKGVYKIEQNHDNIVALVSSEMRIYSPPFSCENYHMIGKNVTSDFRNSYVKMEKKNLYFYEKGEPLWNCSMNDTLLSKSFYIVNSKLVAFSPKKYSTDKLVKPQRKIYTIDDRCNVNLIADTLFIEAGYGWMRSNKSFLSIFSSNGNKFYLASIDSIDGHIKGLLETPSNMSLVMKDKIYSIRKRELMKDSIVDGVFVSNKIEHQFYYYKNHPHPMEVIFICGENICSRNQVTKEVKLIKE